MERIEIIGVITGFDSNDITDNPDWFRQDRAVPFWLNENSGELTPVKNGVNPKLAF